MSRPERLYGLPDAEVLHADIATVWEVDIDPDYRGEIRWEVEEWTVADPIESMMTPAMMVETIAEWVSDEWGDDPWPATLPWHNEKCLHLARELREAIAACVTYHQADQKVATHVITLDADGKPLLDGEPLYYRRDGA